MNKLLSPASPVLFLLGAFAPALLAQEAASLPPALLQNLRTVQARAVEHPTAFSILQELSDDIGPRLTGSPREALAVRWALAQMQRAGLTGVHSEPWQLPQGWQRGYARGQIVSPFPLELALTSLGWAGSTAPGGIEADVIQVDAGALADEIPAQWANKILLIAPKDPAKADAFKTLSAIPALLPAAIQAHALALIVPDWRPGAGLPHTGPATQAAQSAGIPMIVLAREQEKLIGRVLASGKPVRIRLDVRNTFTPGAVPSSNVVGEIRGSQHPEQIVIVGAHLDSWDQGTGAIDDGFGVAAVLGAAHSIVSSGIQPKRTLRFILFTGEEQGLLGSKSYVQAHARELKDIVCAFALDWGNGPITKLPLAGHDELRVPFEELFASLPDLARIKVVPGFLNSTDAYAFSLIGVPGIAPFQESPAYSQIAHSAADTLDKVDPAVLAVDSAVLALTAFWFADYPVRLGSTWSPEEIADKLRQ